MKTCKRGPDGKVSRRIAGRRLRWDAPWLVLTLAYTDGTEEATVYRVEETGSDAGRSFDLWRVEGEGIAHYRVDLGGDGSSACTCKARAYRSGDCKHIAALRKLIDRQLLPGGIPGPGDE